MNISEDTDASTSTVSANWKILQKILRNEGSKTSATEKNIKRKNNGFGTVVVQRKRKANFEAKSNSVGNRNNLWKKRRAEILEATSSSIKLNRKVPELTEILALDCEFVGKGQDGASNMLARISIVNSEGAAVYDKYVKPTERVTDFRTEFSGIRPLDLINGSPFKQVQIEVNKLIAGRIVVGHALHNDFKVLNIAHPRNLTRDTSKYLPLKELTGKKHPSLKLLAKQVLGINIQDGEHNSIIDAQAALKIYMLYRKNWENEHRKLHKKKS